MDAPRHAVRRDDGALSFLIATLPLSDRWMLGCYLVVSLLSALSGGAAALLFAALLQPHATVHLLGLLPPGAPFRLAFFTGAAAAFSLLRWQASRIGAQLTGRYGMRLRQQVHARLLAAELAPLAGHSSAEIANVLTYNAETIVQGFSAVQQLLVAGVTAGVSLSLAFSASPLLLLAAPPLVVLALLASRFHGREQVEVGRRYVADMTRLFWHSEDFPRRLRHVRSFARADAERRSYGEVAEGLSRGYARQLELIASGRLWLELSGLCAITLLFFLVQRWRVMDSASLIAVCLLLGRLFPYLVSSRQGLQQIRSAAPAFALWKQYMMLPAVMVPTATSAPLVSRSHVPSVAQAMSLTFRRVCVSPPLPAMEVTDLSLRPGELLLIRGDSGIGKTSLVDVLAGMAPASVFDVLVDNEPVDYEGYCRHVRRGAYVSQSVRPWQADVRDCLRWASPEATDVFLREVLCDVGLDERLFSRGAGLDTALDDASNRLSEGEMQRLLLAQVILREPVIALLDEATSALDAASELAVLSALRRRLPQSILIVVSHRDGVAAMADQCLVLREKRLRVE